MSPLSRRVAFFASGLLAGTLLYFWNAERTEPEIEAPRRVAQPPAPAPELESKPESEQKKWRLASASERADIARTIRAQLEAFRRDDWSEAVSHQSDGLKTNFASTEDFRRVIESNYPQFANYRSVEFRAIRIGGKWAMAEIALMGQDGVRVSALYQMVRENGVYKVAGVSGGTQKRPRLQEPPRDLV